MLRYSLAAYSDIALELQPLLKRHFEEVALDKAEVPLHVDHLRYAELDANGALVIVTARDPEADHRLVGYIAAFVTNHLHYASTLFASLDVFWMEPDYRKAANGMRLFAEMEAELARRGVVKMVGQTKVRADLDVSAIYQWLGWTKTEVLFTKILRKEA